MTTETVNPLPIPPLESVTAQSSDKPVAQPSDKPVAQQTSSVEQKPKPKKTTQQKLAKLMPTHAFPIRHMNGGIVFYPGTPSAEVPVDAWLENQIAKGILKEV